MLHFNFLANSFLSLFIIICALGHQIVSLSRKNCFLFQKKKNTISSSLQIPKKSPDCAIIKYYQEASTRKIKQCKIIVHKSIRNHNILKFYKKDLFLLVKDLEEFHQKISHSHLNLLLQSPSQNGHQASNPGFILQNENIV